MIEKVFVEVERQPIARVTFRLPDSILAGRISLVGDFNDWNTQSHFFARSRSGDWEITIDLETRRAYQFRYLCDTDNWMNDQQADAHVYNSYGSDNFVVITDPDFQRYSDQRTANR